jgi:hypothetical protein
VYTAAGSRRKAEGKAGPGRPRPRDALFTDRRFSGQKRDTFTPEKRVIS